MRALLKYVRFVDALSERLGTISMYLVIITVFIGFSNVLLRYLGRFVGQRLTSNLFIELQWYLYSLVFFFGFAYILKNGINVRVDFWYAEQSAKVKAWIDLVGHLVSLIPFCIIGLWVTVSPVLKSWGLHPDGSWGTWELSPDPSGLPRAPIKTMIILAFFSLLLQSIAELIKLIAILREQEDLVADVLSKGAESPLRIE
ncbi:MAG: TRAP transporter small permease subunit [Ardenticatenaceae bacterium]|nr:TRAP transporter small permease subunit [Anaerolineales bacterium]MCB8920567.1 TRAP transporter small permease subunit [Ardenticatenaceae bacterium]MCB8990190.1 TRAP transporter small permease subunit [Ardenticatenaceae bacterium]MCB9003019.1 TRAP transporter small permease subunit [Ardenticatenaceae bacterium]